MPPNSAVVNPVSVEDLRFLTWREQFLLDRFDIKVALANHSTNSATAAYDVHSELMMIR